MKAEIVQCGGLEPLLRFTQTSTDAGLVGLIYYSLSKLSLVDENKAAVGAHVPLLIDLLRGDVAEYKGHALKTLVNLVTHAPSRAKMLELDIVRLLLRVLGAVHSSVQPEASLLLLNFVSIGDHKDRAQAEVFAEVKAVSAWIEGWAGIKDKDDRLRIYFMALANIMQMLTVCCSASSDAHRLDEGRKLLGVVCSVLPIRKPECEAAILGFLLLFLKADTPIPPAVLEQTEKLVESLNSSDKVVLMRATLILSTVLRDPSLQTRESLWAKINPVSVVDHFLDADPAVRAASVDLFALLASKPGAAAGLQRDASSFTKLGDALLTDHSLSRKLTASLAALSTVPEIKYALVTGSLRQGLLASMSITRDGAQVTEQVLEVFANCTSNAGARRALADPKVLFQLLDALKSPSQDVQTRVGSVLANLSTNPHIRRELRDLFALGPIFGAIMATKNRHLRLELMGAAGNICLLGLHLSKEHLAYLISVLSSKSVKLRVASVKVLRNACLNHANIEALIALKAAPPLLSFLVDQAKPDDQAHILTILSALIECDEHAVDFLELSFVLGLISQYEGSPNSRVAKSGLRCVSAAARYSSAFLRDHLRVLLGASKRHQDYVASEYASLALSRCLIQNPDLVTTEVVEQLLALCLTPSPAVLRHVLQVLATPTTSALLSLQDCDLLACLLDFPETSVSESVAALIMQVRGGEGDEGTMRVSPLAVLQLLQQEHLNVTGPSVWEIRPVEQNQLTIMCLPLTLNMGTSSHRNVFLANLLAPSRPRLALLARETWHSAADANSASLFLENAEGLAALFKSVSSLGHSLSQHVDDVLEDATIGVVSGERGSCSGATRKWGAHSELLKCTGGLEVCYVANFDGGPAAVVAEGPVPHLGEFAYFEVLITAGSIGGVNGFAVGMAASVEEGRLPGWPAGSFGYHGDDGNFYFGGNHRAFGPRFGLGDVVGCGCDEIKGDLFFTLNGRFLGVAVSGVNSFKLRPSVGMVQSGQKLLANFGQLPFLWDFSFDNVAPSAALTPAPRATVPAFPRSEEVATVTPAMIAGGLWNAKVEKLAPRLCFVNPQVHDALQQTRKLFAKWE